MNKYCIIILNIKKKILLKIKSNKNKTVIAHFNQHLNAKQLKRKVILLIKAKPKRERKRKR